MTRVIVMAKECVPGRVKTRLHPPYSLAQAAQIAQASLEDTFAAVTASGLGRIACAAGEVNAPGGFDTIAQGEGGLDQRIGAVLDAVPGPVLLIGMDTPQVRARDLAHWAMTWPDDVDAYFGYATDGGFWLLGLRDLSDLPGARGDLVRGVAMSADDTGRQQYQRLIDAGLRVQLVPASTDIDDVDALAAVRGDLPAHSRLAALLDRWDREAADADAAATHAAETEPLERAA